jgi:hypothetical protein
VDIGLDVKKVEEELETRFQLASNWEAVLLFDEADIMLEARDIEGDLKRNAMVSGKCKISWGIFAKLFLTLRSLSQGPRVL